MKISELRIGNFVDVTEEYREMKITSLTEDGDINYAYKEKDIEGIPIMEEWFKKFGFEWDGNRFNDTKNDGWKMGVYSIEGKIRWQFDMYNHIKIEYVHQLQNLYYALTGRELVLAVTPK